MKLLFFISSLSGGGAERVTANLANHWARSGWQVTVVTLSSKTLDFYELNPGVKRIALDFVGDSPSPFTAITNNLHRLVALRQVLRQDRPQVALAMMSSSNILLALATIGLRGIATVGSERTHPPQFPLGVAWETLRKYLYRRLTAVVALTEESAAWLHQNTRVRKITVIPNAVYWPLPDLKPHIKIPALPVGGMILLAVGRMSEEKQFDLLITVFQRLASDLPDWVLVILGEGPDRKLLEAQVQSTGLRDRILLPGRAGNVGRWYETADLYVMSSRFEGFPNSLVEAMAHGCAAVSFDCDTGPRDIIRHEVDGLLVPAGDLDALEAALRRMMSDTSLRHRFAERASETRERFSIGRIADMWKQLFEEVKQ